MATDYSQSSKQGYAQVAVDGAGKKVLNFTKTITLDDGSEHVVLMQAVVLCDPDGKPVDLTNQDLQLAQLEKLDAIIELLELLLSSG